MDKLQQEWNNFKSSHSGSDNLEENWEKFKANHLGSGASEVDWDKLQSNLDISGLKEDWNGLQDTRHKLMTGLQLILFFQAQSPRCIVTPHSN
ncbi:hypothetical protein TWF481_010414 [Arthrobotrys musiformis]|uniref:Uncharacterized protein n=1 Tax=Arthrobotrys musiformis TaxID=47236 RepID=A0AAV9W0W2_9PEZI